MKEILVTGCAVFIGQNLVTHLLQNSGSDRVIGLDNFFSGSRHAVERLKAEFPQRFIFVEADVRNREWMGHVERSLIETLTRIFHLACPASPPRYLSDPRLTWETSVIGTANVLDLAQKHHARVLFTSTSEVYGDPLEHPQRETYWGNVNTWGPRACYDEGKRAAETLCFIHQERYGLAVRVARIFNTFGPGMDPRDGRVLTALFSALKQKTSLPVFGDGSQTRSFCFIDDMVRGLVRLMQSEVCGPVNLGNPEEITILKMAEMVQKMALPEKLEISYHPLPQDDPKRRLPDISRAKRELQWEPTISLEQGLKKFWDWIQVSQWLS